jgi:carbon-monoxide dehydrogenase large subunit
VFPWTAGIEALMAGGLLTGPYKLDHYRCDVVAVATHTTPAGPYRGVARPATTFVMERVLDLGARALALDPVDIRRVNLIAAADLPYTAPTRLVHDSPSYPVCFDTAVQAIGYAGFREEQARLRRQGRHVGVGFAVYNELTGLGQAASAGPRMPFRTGHEGACVRMDPSGAVTVLAGVTSQGQGLETTVAQLAAAELAVPVESVERPRRPRRHRRHAVRPRRVRVAPGRDRRRRRHAGGARRS